MWIVGIVIIAILFAIFAFRKKPSDKEVARKQLASLITEIDDIAKNLTAIKAEIVNLEQKKIFSIAGDLKELTVGLNERITELEKDITAVRTEIEEIKKF